MGLAGLRIGLSDCYGKFLEDVDEAALGNFVPLDRNRLCVGNHIANGGLHLFNGVWSRPTDQDIAESCNTVCIGDGILIHGQAGKRGAIKMKFCPFHEVVLGAFDDLKGAVLEHVAEGDGRGLAANDGHLL